MNDRTIRKKICGCCGTEYVTMPLDAKPDLELRIWYWQCTCHSTLTYIEDWDFTSAKLREGGFHVTTVNG